MPLRQLHRFARFHCTVQDTAPLSQYIGWEDSAASSVSRIARFRYQSNRRYEYGVFSAHVLLDGRNGRLAPTMASARRGTLASPGIRHAPFVSEPGPTPESGGNGWTIGGKTRTLYWMETDDRMGGRFRASTPTATNELLRLVADIDEFKGAWQAIGRIAPERRSALRRVATIESIGSSTRIEGAALSDGEVERLLANVDVQSFATRDEQEVAGYADTMQMVFGSWQAIDLTENHIKQLHLELLKFSMKDERHRGEYKTLPNHVEAFDPDGRSLGVVFETAAPFETPGRMADLVAWTREALNDGGLHPLLVIGVFVVTFLAIHPFQDGNGRLARILTTLLLLRSGYGYVPYGSLESVIERTRDAYYLALRRTQRSLGSETPDWQPWLAYFLNALQQQKDRLRGRIERERLMLGDLPVLSVRILDIARDRGRVSVAEAANVTGASRNTIKDHLRALVTAGHLARHGAGRGSWYSLG